jgi:pimeloyl-ACP methyl ester carboxylesterase
MPTAACNGVELCYEAIGDPADRPLLLVMGFTAQLIAWDDRFVRGLADHGHYVIRFDNRDCGLSTHLDGVEVVAGASMGGMIVQTMAVEHPERLLSMTSIMSSTGEPDYGQASEAALEALMTPPPDERDAFVAYSVERSKLYCSPRYFDEAKVATRAGASFDRAFYPEGAGRQMAAVRASGHRAEALRQVRVPTLVIHGRQDTLIDYSGGLRTAELITGANFLLLHDMGHDLPEPLWPLLTDAITSHTRHAIG